MRDAARRGDMNDLVEHDIAFHRLIVEVGGDLAILSSAGSLLGVEGRITRSRCTTPTFEPRRRPSSTGRSSRRSAPANAARRGREARKHVEAFARIARSRVTASSSA